MDKKRPSDALRGNQQGEKRKTLSPSEQLRNTKPNELGTRHVLKRAAIDTNKLRKITESDKEGE